MEIITDNSYNKKIINTDTTEPFILMFESKTCPHCKTVKNTLKRIDEDKNKPCNINIYVIRAEESPKLINQYAIRSFPTTLFFCKNRSIRHNILGGQSLEAFVSGYNKVCQDFNKQKKEKSSFFKSLFGKK